MKHYFIYLYSIPFFLSASLYGQEFIYPVATFSADTVALMHQSAINALDLCVANVTTKSMSSGLYSRFTPTHVALLPDGSGFSFIDNGMIRIKFFHKRSPKTLELADSLYGISSMIWEDQFNVYISAQYRNNYALFCIDSDGASRWGLTSQGADFLHQQKQGENLFFIQRSTVNKEINYAVSLFKFNNNLQETTENINNNRFELTQKEQIFQYENYCQMGDVSQIKTVIDFGNQPIAFLAMEHSNSGFVVSHPASIQLFKKGTDNKSVVFSYYHISCHEHKWHKEKLFDFAIPLDFLAPEGKNKLHEYMFPLLPKKIDTFIYYSHSVDGALNIFKYCLKTHQSFQVTYATQKNEHFFCPIKVGSAVYCGGSMSGELETFSLKKIS